MQMDRIHYPVGVPQTHRHPFAAEYSYHLGTKLKVWDGSLARIQQAAVLVYHLGVKRAPAADLHNRIQTQSPQALQKMHKE